MNPAKYAKTIHDMPASVHLGERWRRWGCDVGELGNQKKKGWGVLVSRFPNPYTDSINQMFYRVNSLERTLHFCQDKKIGL